MKTDFILKMPVESRMMWCVGDGVPMKTVPIVGVEVMKLPKYAKVQVMAESIVDHGKEPTKFYEVKAWAGVQGWVQGWVYSGYLEPYTEEFEAGVVKIKNATPNPNDAAQYLHWMNQVQYNLCGQFCVCYCTGWDADVEDFLDRLTPTFISRIFPQGKGRGTSDYDLVAMLAQYETRNIGALLYDQIARRTILTAGRMVDILKEKRVIYSVHINRQTGRLERAGVLHWVVLEEVTPDEFSGRVLLYNPYKNKMERYQWEQVVESGGVPYGVAVERSQ